MDSRDRSKQLPKNVFHFRKGRMPTCSKKEEGPAFILCLILFLTAKHGKPQLELSRVGHFSACFCPLVAIQIDEIRSNVVS